MQFRDQVISDLKLTSANYVVVEFKREEKSYYIYGNDVWVFLRTTVSVKDETVFKNVEAQQALKLSRKSLEIFLNLLENNQVSYCLVAGDDTKKSVLQLDIETSRNSYLKYAKTLNWEMYSRILNKKLNIRENEEEIDYTKRLVEERPYYREPKKVRSNSSRKPRIDSDDKPRSYGDRKPREGFGDKPRSYVDRKPREGYGDKPRNYGDREPREGFGDKPRSYGDRKPREGSADKTRSYGDRKPREGSGDKPRSYGDRKPREGSGDKPRSYGDRKPREGFSGKPKSYGSRKSNDKSGIKSKDTKSR